MHTVTKLVMVQYPIKSMGKSFQGFVNTCKCMNLFYLFIYLFILLLQIRIVNLKTAMGTPIYLPMCSLPSPGLQLLPLLGTFRNENLSVKMQYDFSPAL